MKVLIQTPLDTENLITKQFVLSQRIKELNLGKITIFSPSVFITQDVLEKAEVTATLFSVAHSIHKEPELLPWLPDADICFYIGMAPKNIKFDENIVYDKNTLSTQEEYLKSEMGEELYKTLTTDILYTSDTAEIDFIEQDDLLDYLLLRCKNETRT